MKCLLISLCNLSTLFYDKQVLFYVLCVTTAFFCVYFIFFFTLFREQDETYITSLRWSALVGLEPAYTLM